MKTKIIVIIILFPSFLFAQSTVKQRSVQDVVKSHVEELLIDGKTIYSKGEIKKIKNEILALKADVKKLEKNKRKNKKEIKKKNISIKKKESNLEKDKDFRGKILIRYPYPKSYSSDKVIEKQNIKDVNISLLGSYLIKGAYPLTGFPPSYPPNLPVLSNKKQVGIFDPKRSNYELQFNLNYLFSLTSAVDLGVETGYFNSKVTLANEYTNKRTNSLNVAVGIFNNYLASVFANTINNTLTKKTDFYPLLKLWTEYCNKKDIRSNKSNYHIIKSFKGLSVYQDNSIKLQSGQDYKFYANANYTIPFLSVSSEASSNWSKSDDFKSSEEVFSIYMLETPSLQDIPTPQHILNNWRRFRMKPTQYKSNDNMLDLLPKGTPCEVIVEFGPIPGHEKLVLVDTEFTLKSLKGIKIIKPKIDITPVAPNEGGMWNYKISFYRNDDIFKTAKINNNKVEQTCTLRLYFNQKLKNANKGDVLYRDYEVNLTSKTLPPPVVDEENIKSASNNNNYEWTIPVEFKTGENTSNLKVTSISFKDTKLNQLSKKFRFKQKTKGQNEFELGLLVTMEPDYIKYDMNEVVEIELEVAYNKSKYKRKITTYIPIKNNITTALPPKNIIVKPEELKSAIKSSFKFSSGKTLDEIINFKSVEEIIQLIVDELKLEYIPDQGYEVNTSYLTSQFIKGKTN